MLLSKGIKSLKFNITDKYYSNQIVNYCTSNINQPPVSNSDYYETIQNDIRRRYNESASVKVQDDEVTQNINFNQLQNRSESISDQIDFNKQSEDAENNDELLENIYLKYVDFKSRMILTR